MGSTLKGKNVLPFGADAFFYTRSIFRSGVVCIAKQNGTKAIKVAVGTINT